VRIPRLLPLTLHPLLFSGATHLIPIL
jgi:hypothetical protein